MTIDRDNFRPVQHGRRGRCRRQRRRGTILIVTMTITFALAAIVLILSRKMAVEAQASANQAASVQAGAVERAAEQYVMALLNLQATDSTTYNVYLYTDDYFSAYPVGADSRNPDGWFWIVRPSYDDTTLPMFGLVDEASKLNINTATEAQLLSLPEMSQAQDIAEAILDWRTATESTNLLMGAKSDYYLSLPDPHFCKNGTFETVEELQMVRGINYAFLYGDGTAPALGNYDTAMSNAGNGINGDPQLARGFYDLLTVNSDTAAAAGGGGGAGAGTVTAGAINLNTAPAPVLSCLQMGGQQLDSSVVQSLVGQRYAANAYGGTDLSWLSSLSVSTQSFNTGTTVQVTGSPSYRCSADIVAVSANGRAFKRVRVIFDTRYIGTAISSDAMTSASSGVLGPVIVYRRDITDQGWPLDQSILDQVRSGSFGGSTNSTMGAFR
jgi:DNA uptake protein ComE-like DNA-binding protein